MIFWVDLFFHLAHFCKVNERIGLNVPFAHFTTKFNHVKKSISTCRHASPAHSTSFHCRTHQRTRERLERTNDTVFCALVLLHIYFACFDKWSSQMLIFSWVFWMARFFLRSHSCIVNEQRKWEHSTCIILKFHEKLILAVASYLIYQVNRAVWWHRKWESVSFEQFC